MTLTPLHKDLIRRYLTWAYKSTKESFDRLERKTTQLMADEYIWKNLVDKDPVPAREYQEYIARKKAQPVAQEQHAYLKDRLQAVEKAIKYFLGVKELNAIRAGYEQEFTRRIWEAKDH